MTNSTNSVSVSFHPFHSFSHFTYNIALHLSVFVGGNRSVSDDIKEIRKGVQIVVCTTGRICQLVNDDIITTNHIRLFVLDEADKLMQNDFQKDINFLFSSLPQNKQIAVFSATYPRDLDETLAKYMTKVHLIRLNEKDVQLLGIKQYVALNYADNPIQSLIRLLSSITFSQCLVFANDQQRCEKILGALHKAEMLDSESICGSMEQVDRNRIMKKLKNFQLKILVSTDLTARGIDAENVNLVINIGCPLDSETYLHRIGRAGRFGGYGAAVTILSTSREVKRFMNLMNGANLRVKLLHLTKEYPSNLCQNQTFYEQSSEFEPSKKTDSDQPMKLLSHGSHTVVEQVTAELSSSSKEEAQNRSTYLTDNDNDSNSENDNDNDNGRDSTNANELLNDGEEKLANGMLSAEIVQKIRQLEGERKHKSQHDDVGHQCNVNVNHHHLFNDQPSSSSSNPLLLTNDNQQSAVAQQRSTSCAAESASENPSSSSEKALKKSKFKRLATRKPQPIVYLRGELLRIRESLSKSEWLNYALNRYPGLVSDKHFVVIQPKSTLVSRTENGRPSMDGNKENISVKSLSKPKPSSNQTGRMITYDRNELTAIRNSRCAQEWLLWAQTKKEWNLREEPYVMDDELRVPFAQQLRVNREREKRNRDAVQTARHIAEAAEASARSNLLFSSSIYPLHVDIPGTFEEYKTNFYDDYRKFNEKVGDKRDKRVGPVVTISRKPQQYNEAVNEASSYLKNIKSSFWSQLKLDMGYIKEVSISTEQSSQISKVDVSVQTDAIIGKENEEIKDGKESFSQKHKNQNRHNKNNIDNSKNICLNQPNVKELHSMHSEMLNNYYYYLNYYTNKYFSTKRNT